MHSVLSERWEIKYKVTYFILGSDAFKVCHVYLYIYVFRYVCTFSFRLHKKTAKLIGHLCWNDTLIKKLDSRAYPGRITFSIFMLFWNSNMSDTCNR